MEGRLSRLCCTAFARWVGKSSLECEHPDGGHKEGVAYLPLSVTAGRRVPGRPAPGGASRCMGDTGLKREHISVAHITHGLGVLRLGCELLAHPVLVHLAQALLEGYLIALLQLVQVVEDRTAVRSLAAE